METNNTEEEQVHLLDFSNAWLVGQKKNSVSEKHDRYLPKFVLRPSEMPPPLNFFAIDCRSNFDRRLGRFPKVQTSTGTYTSMYRSFDLVDYFT